ncbi:hypothetical protein JJ691_32670 [Kutzneria sp. CA-103260]|nr:hypothetical protein JJ691_32670 [Kutzneria sp. CA-103260]
MTAAGGAGESAAELDGGTGASAAYVVSGVLASTTRDVGVSKCHCVDGIGSATGLGCEVLVAKKTSTEHTSAPPVAAHITKVSTRCLVLCRA